jgi:hypothetical protein
MGIKMENPKIKSQYLFLLSGLLFLSLFLIYLFNFNIEIDNIYLDIVTGQLVVPKKNC